MCGLYGLYVSEYTLGVRCKSGVISIKLKQGRHAALPAMKILSSVDTLLCSPYICHLGTVCTLLYSTYVQYSILL